MVVKSFIINSGKIFTLEIFRLTDSFGLFLFLSTGSCSLGLIYRLNLVWLSLLIIFSYEVEGVVRITGA